MLDNLCGEMMCDVRSVVCDVRSVLSNVCGDMLKVLFEYMTTRDIRVLCVAWKNDMAWKLFSIRRDADDNARIAMEVVRHYVIAEKMYYAGRRAVSTHIRVPNERAWYLEDSNVDEAARLFAGAEYRRSYWESVRDEGFEEVECVLLDASELCDDIDDIDEIDDIDAIEEVDETSWAESSVSMLSGD